MSILVSRIPRVSAMRRGFTLVELLIVIGIVAVLSSLLLPALSRSKARAHGIFCLNNTRQLMIACAVYADDHNGRFPYNLGVRAARTLTPGMNTTPPMSANWVDNVLDWELNPDNTNDTKMVRTGLGPYAGKAITTYRCPSDRTVSEIQRQAGWERRVRSYSMNAMIGDAGNFSQSGVNVNNPEYVQFFKISSVPRPAGIFVFLDEHADSIDDGYFLNRASRHEWNDLPASYHNGAGSFSFVDGHADLRRWRNASTRSPSRPGGARLPIQLEYTGPKSLEDFYWVISAMSVEAGAEYEHQSEGNLQSGPPLGN